MGSPASSITRSGADHSHPCGGYPTDHVEEAVGDRPMMEMLSPVVVVVMVAVLLIVAGLFVAARVFGRRAEIRSNQPSQDRDRRDAEKRRRLRRRY